MVMPRKGVIGEPIDGGTLVYNENIRNRSRRLDIAVVAAVIAGEVFDQTVLGAVITRGIFSWLLELNLEF